MVEFSDKPVKDYLLKTNPSKVDTSNFSETFGKFVEIIDYLKDRLLLSQSQLTDQERLVLTDTLSIWFLRSTQFIKSKKIDSTEYEVILRDEILTGATSNMIFQYVIDFWAETGPALVNALRDLFSKFMTLSKLIQDNQIYQSMCQSWLFHILEIPSTLKVQYYLIEALASDIDLYQIIEKKPDFLSNSLSLMKVDSLSTPVGKCVVNLLLNIFNIHYNGEENKIDEWITLWKATLLEFLDNKQYTKSINIYILEPLLKMAPVQAFHKFVGNGFQDSPAQLLSVLRLGQELKIEEEPYKDNKLVSMETLEKLLQTNTYKLQAFELLTFSIKSSKPIELGIYELIKSTINAFFLDVEIETRNYFWSSFKHFLYRIRDSTYALNRDAVKLSRANKFPEEVQEKLKLVSISEDFLKWFINLLIFHLTPGTSYQSNHLAFKFILLLLELGLDKNAMGIIAPVQDKREFPFSFEILSNKSLFRVLVDHLASKFPDIRENSRNILLVIIKSIDTESVHENIDLKDLEQRANSSLEVYQYCDIGASIHEFLYSISLTKTEYVGKLVNQLNIMLSMYDGENTSYVMQPIGGYFIGLKSVMNLHCKEIIHVNDNKTVSHCLDLVLSNWNAMKDISCHEASDSIVPIKFQNSGISDNVITTQAFRAIKEASELLEVLLLKYKISVKQVETIGELLIEQLFYIRHSGAFQAVLPAFRTCVSKCQEIAPEILEKWLQEALNVIETKTQHITRRSGGIPFIVTTILASETNEDHPLLSLAFAKLMEIAEVPITEFQDKLDLPQVNAHNCIKAIFVETKLSRACMPYVTESLGLSLTGFVSEFWAIRNCAMMLFTAIQNRLFGKSGKDYAARLFFTRFHGVRALLHSTLLNATNSIIEKDKNVDRNIESLFLIANLLSRLKPTPGFDGLDEFCVLLKKSLSCSNWEVRELVSKAIAKLIIFSEGEIVELINNLNLVNQNRLHGELLLLKYILTSFNQSYNVVLTSTIINSIVSKSQELIGNNSCWVTIKSYSEIISIVLESPAFSASNRDVLTKCFGSFYCGAITSYKQDGTRQLALAKIFSILIFLESTENLRDIILLTLYCDYYECHILALDYILSNGIALDGFENELAVLCEQLFDNGSTLPQIRAMCLHVLSILEPTKSKRLVIETFQDTNIEPLYLKSIELLGGVINTTNIDELWVSLEANFGDNQLVDIRNAALNCVGYNNDLLLHPKILYQLFLNLEDDDEHIRKETSKCLVLNLTDMHGIQTDISPSQIESNFFDLLKNHKLSQNEFMKIAEDKLKEYLNATPIVKNEKSVDTDAMFETERDNQYRNETFQYYNLIYLLLQSQDENMHNSLKVFTLMYLEKLEMYIKESGIEDSCLGWLSKPELFTRMFLLRLIIQKLAPGHLKKLDDILHIAKVHPAIFLPSNWECHGMGLSGKKITI